MASKAKWNGNNTLTQGGRKASNSHVGNPIDTSTPRIANGLNLIGNKSKLHSL